MQPFSLPDGSKGASEADSAAGWSSSEGQFDASVALGQGPHQCRETAGNSSMRQQGGVGGMRTPRKREADFVSLTQAYEEY